MYGKIPGMPGHLPGPYIMRPKFSILRGFISAMWKATRTWYILSSLKKYYIFQVSEDNKKVRRVKTKPLPKDSVEARKEAKNRTIYCVCFLQDCVISKQSLVRIRTLGLVHDFFLYVTERCAVLKNIKLLVKLQ